MDTWRERGSWVYFTNLSIFVYVPKYFMMKTVFILGFLGKHKKFFVELQKVTLHRTVR